MFKKKIRESMGIIKILKMRKNKMRCLQRILGIFYYKFRNNKNKNRLECFSMAKNTDKGMHEKAMKKARNLLEQSVGITEIMDITGLSEEDILKEQQKMRR